MVLRSFAVLLGAALVLSISACSEQEPSAGPASSDVRSKKWIKAVADDLMADVKGCKRTYMYADDIYFWDRAVGFDCVRSELDVTTVLVYRHEGSPLAAFVESGRASPSEPVLVSEHVLIYGGKDELPSFAQDLEAYSEGAKILTEVPPDAAMMDTRQQYLSMCAQFAASSLAAYASGTPEPSEDVAQHEQAYPGYKALMSKLFASDEMQKLDGLEVRDPAAFEPALSQFGGSVKRMCEDSR